MISAALRQPGNEGGLPPAALRVGREGAIHADLPGLARALNEEAKLLADLRGVLERQRAAVAADDLPGVDASVFDAQRILRSLSQARRRRRSLLTLTAGEDGHHLAELPELLGPAMTPELASALDRVLATAQRVARDMDLNRQILNGALATGNEILRALGRTEPSPVYAATPSPPGGNGSNSLLLNRQV